MSVQRIWLGAVGPYLYDDEASIEDDSLEDGEQLAASLMTTGQIRVFGEPTEDEHILRLADIGLVIPTLPQDLDVTDTPTFAGLNLTNPLEIIYGGTDANSAADARINLGLEIGVNVQVYSIMLENIANLTTAAGLSMIIAANAAAQTELLSYFTSSLRGVVPASGGGTVNFLRADGTWAPAGVTDAELVAIAGLTSAADTMPYFTGSGTAALATITTFGRSLVDDADATAARVTLGLVINTNIQAYDAELAAIAGLTSAADKVPYFTGSGTAALADLTTFARSFLDDADAVTVQATLGLAALATLATVGTSQIDADSVTYAKIQNVSATSRLLGRITSGAGDVEELTGTQATTLLDAFTSSLKGLAPSSGGGTANYLRADGSWASPPGSGSGSGAGGAISWSGLDEAPVTANAKNEEMLAALTSATWIASSGSPTNTTWTTFWDDSTGPADPRYNVDGTIPGCLVMQPKSGARLMVYKSFAPASGTKWAIVAKIHMFFPSGTNDYIRVGISNATPTVSSDDVTNSIAGELRATDIINTYLASIRPGVQTLAGATSDASAGYIAIVGRTDNSIRTFLSRNGIAWRLGEALTGATINGAVNYAYIYVGDYHNSGMPVIAMVEYWRFLEGDNNVYAMGLGQ
jgi:hypothetical protein